MKEVAKEAASGTLAGVVFVIVVMAFGVLCPWSCIKRTLGLGPKPIPQERGRYQLLTAGGEIVKLDTATGHAWTVKQVHWARKWESIAEESTFIYYRDPKTDSLRLEQDPLGIR